jgi:tetratricopeptide (TPR) repeat protein
MTWDPNTGRKRLRAVLLSLALLPLLPGSCQRKFPAPMTRPPLPNYFDAGEKYFDAGDYANAVQSYELYLQTNPAASHRDLVLFRMALAHAFPASPVQDLSKSLQLLAQLVTQFPQSSYRPQAEFLLSLHAELDTLRAGVAEREQDIQKLSKELDERDRSEQVDREALRSDVTKKEERIKQLSEELEKLKQIDMQRRPSAVPPITRPAPATPRP